MNFKKKAKYLFDRFLSRGTFSLIMMLFLITFISVLIVGIIAFFVSGDNSIFHVIWISFMQTLDAGNLSGEEGTFLYIVMMTVSTIVGLFVTSLLISFVSNGFQTKLENLQKGASGVIEKNHTLILGYNDNVSVLVGELIQANLNVRKPVIVILTDRDLIETTSDLKLKLKKFHNSDIIVRTGSIFDKDDLNRMSISDAKSVILACDNDSETIKTILAIRQTAFFESGHVGYISTILNKSSNIAVAKNIGKDKLEVIHLADSMNRIMAQTCLQPGLSFIYKDVFDFSGDEFYFYRHNNALTGLTFREVLSKSNHSTIVGLFRNQEVLLNPSMDALVEENDQIICISEDDDTIYMDGNPMVLSQMIVNGSHRQNKVKRHILSIGCNESTLPVMKEFKPYVKPGSKITFLFSEVKTEEELEPLKLLEFIDYDIIYGDTTDLTVLSNINYHDIDTIIIFGSHLEDDEQSDSDTLLTVLHLRELEKKLKLNFQIVIEIRKNANADIMQYASIDDFVVSNVLTNKMLAQIAENRYLRPVFEELLTSEGSEIYLKPAEEYVLLDESVNFYTVIESASKKKEVAIGYKKKSIKKKGGIFVNPRKDEYLTFEVGDMIIVICED